MMQAVPLLLSAALAVASCGLSFDTLVTFGDSYTDNGRLAYYINHGGNAPLPGTLHDETNVTASGGLTWPQFVARNTGVTLVDYAISAATCSNSIVSRWTDILNRTFPSVTNDELISFASDEPFPAIFPRRTAEGTVYALWIGTNDVGSGGFLRGLQAPGMVLGDFVNCVWSVFDTLYQLNGRRFVLFNQAPLELSPLYAAPDSGGGIVESRYWPDKTAYNMTEESEKIKEYTTSINTMFEYGLPFHLLVKRRWPGADFTLFDTHSLLTDMWKQPIAYLDAPYNVTGFYHHCDGASGICVDLTDLGPLSAFLWYDELHPSEKTDAIIADHFLRALAGKSQFATRYSS